MKLPHSTFDRMLGRMQPQTALWRALFISSIGLFAIFVLLPAVYADEPNPQSHDQPERSAKIAASPRAPLAPAANSNLTLDTLSGWFSQETSLFTSVAWGDVDGDGDLDLAASSDLYSTTLYLNEGNMLSDAAAWSSSDSTNASSLAWGDMDRDGDLDLAVGNAFIYSLKVYRNDNGSLTATAAWTSDDATLNTASIAWGDIDGDGDFDLAAGGLGTIRIYKNLGTTLEANASQTITNDAMTKSLAWGDMDRDGDLDLAVGNGYGAFDAGQQNLVYANNGGTLTNVPSWSSLEDEQTSSIAWGDVNNDGYLDLAAGNYRGPVRLYLNNDGMLSNGASWSSADSDNTTSVAWGDADSDGDLDLAVGNEGQAKKVYQNIGTSLAPAAGWTSGDTNATSAVAWGDMDGDGDLDLATANKNQPLTVYLNSVLFGHHASWSSAGQPETLGLAWGDMDGDGDLDLAAGNYAQPSAVYLNEGGTLDDVPTWTSPNVTTTRSIAWGDVDNDGDLDLATGNVIDLDPAPGVNRENLAPTSNHIYLNQGTMLASTPAWTSAESEASTSVAWADYDGDGDLDLAVGNRTWATSFTLEGGYEQLYRNDSSGGTLSLTPILTTTEQDETYSIAWGDVDGDGDLDLATGNDGPEQIYLNENGVLSDTASWSSTTSDLTYSLVWGDVDNDGDLDLVTGNEGPARIYYNEDGTLERKASWTAFESHTTRSIALGDIDGDGDLDLVLANDGSDTGAPNKAFVNTDGLLSQIADWVSNESDRTNAVALGDVDGDGDLDLAVGNSDQPLKLYLKSNLAPIFFGYTRHGLRLELNNAGANNGVLAPANFFATPAIWQGDSIPISYTLLGPNQLGVREVQGSFSPDGGGHWYPAVAGSDTVTTNLTSSVRAATNPQTPLTIPSPGTLSSTLRLAGTGTIEDLIVSLTTMHPQKADLSAVLWAPWPTPAGTQVTLFNSMAGQGVGQAIFSDQAARSYRSATSCTVYNSTNVPITIPTTQATITSTLVVPVNPAGRRIADINVRNLTGTHSYVSDLSFSLVSPAGTRVDLLSSVCGSSHDFHLNLDDEAAPGGITCPLNQGQTFQPSASLSRFDQQNSVGVWSLVIEDRITQDGGTLTGWSLEVCTESNDYSVGHRGIFQASESLARFDGAPLDTPFSLIITDRTPGPPGTIQWALEVPEVEQRFTWDPEASGFFGQSDNMVFRLAALPYLTPITNSIPGPYQRPFLAAQSYPFRVRGNQVRVLSGTLPVEDAVVYQLENGQTFRGEVLADAAGRAFTTDQYGYLQGRGTLNTGDQLLALVPVSDTNNATLYYTNGTPTSSGVTAATVSANGIQTLTVSSANPLLLFDLAISLEWDARQDSTYLPQLELDLFRASEILYDLSNGQVALHKVTVYQDKEHWSDANVVIYATNSHRPNANLGGIVDVALGDVLSNSQVVTDAYLPGQVRMGSIWNRFGQTSESLGEDWPRALAHELGHYLLFQLDNYLGVSDSGLLTPIDCSGSAMTDAYGESEFLIRAEWDADEECLRSLAERSTGRADWETITQFYPYLKAPTNLATRNAGPATMPYVFTQIEFVDPAGDDDTLIDPYFGLLDENSTRLVPSSGAQSYLFKTQDDSDATNDYVIALGSPNRDLLQARGAAPGDRLCVFDSNHDPIRLGCATVGDDEEDTITLNEVPDWAPDINVTPITSRTLAISVTLTTAESSLSVQVLPIDGAASPETAMLPNGTLNYTRTITLDEPSFYGTVRVWVPGSSPYEEAVTQYYLSGSWGGNYIGPYTNQRGWGGNYIGPYAPIASNDGQVTLFSLDNILSNDGTYALQALVLPPSLPAWLTPVGQIYRLESVEEMPKSSISFSYLQREVPAGQENGLAVYYSADKGSTWQRLATELEPTDNIAASAAPGEGLYALLSTVELPPFAAGWNLFAYPLYTSRSVPQALLSISGTYTTVYGYDPNNTTDPWKVYDVTAPAYVNDLTTLQHGRGYWINISQPITAYLPVDPSKGQPAVTLPTPPATFYGTLNGADNFIPQAGQTVSAWINGKRCGQTQTELVGGEVVYVIHVLADGVGTATGCGTPGQVVTLQVEGQPWTRSVFWDNRLVRTLPLTPGGLHKLYLPLLRRSAWSE